MTLAAAALALALASPQAGDCAAIARMPVTDGRVLSAKAADGACRIVAELSPRPASRIGVHVWLPLQGWSGRYVQLGTGGFAGTIPTAALAAEVQRGNAVAVSDTGHVGEDAFDARWAAGRPERVVDYGHRSIKATVDAGKSLVRAFYAREAAHSYFVGCSNGGRQALMAAQRYPDAFDGVLAGAPAIKWTDQLASFARIQQALRRPGGMIPVATLPAIARAAKAGRPLPPCRPGQTDACLTAPQAAALATIARDFDPAHAATPGGWDAWIVNPDTQAKTQRTLAEQFFRHIVLNQSDWRLEDLSAGDLRRAKALSPVLDARGDLAAFRRRGGKLVIYTGEADPVISPQSAIDYHARMGSSDATRLFVIPGMLHCQGGPGADAFGQSHVSPAMVADPEHDIRSALEAWVERGRPPEAITAVKYVRDNPANGVAARTRVCAYPARRLPPGPVQPDGRCP